MEQETMREIVHIMAYSTFIIISVIILAYYGEKLCKRRNNEKA